MGSDDVARTFQLLSQHTGLVHWTARSPRAHGAVGAYASHATELLTRVNQQDGWDFYVSLNPSVRARVKPAKEDMTCLRVVGIDIDPYPGQDLDTNAVVEELLQAMKHMVGDRKCFTIIHSGRGIWLWIFIKPSFINEAFKVEDADLLIRATTHWLKQRSPKLLELGLIDTASAEISRIARCPGTINTKTKKRAYILLDHDPMEQCDISTLARFVPDYTKDLQSDALTPSDFGLSDTGIITLAPALKLTNRHFLLCGCEKNERHKRLFSLAKDMQELKLTEEQAAPVLALAASRCRPSLLRDDPNFVPSVLRALWNKHQ